MTQQSRDQLLQQARAWVGDDPDPHTRDELTALVDRAVAGDEDAWPELADRFAGFLEFGKVAYALVALFVK